MESSGIFFHRQLYVPSGQISLKADLFIPLTAKAVIIFAQEKGRLSLSGLKVSDALHQKGFGTLLFDMLAADEENNYASRINIDLLSSRLTDTTQWLKSLPIMKRLKIGYFCSGSGITAAINAVNVLPGYVGAVISEGAAMHLEMELSKLAIPALFISDHLNPDTVDSVSNWLKRYLIMDYQFPF